MRKVLFLIAFFSIFSVSGKNKGNITLLSPDGRVRAAVSVGCKKRCLEFSGTYDGRTVWALSSLGVIIDGKQTNENVEIKNIERYSIDESYSLISRTAPLRNHASGMLLDVTDRKTGYSWQMDVRCYDNGLAYRLRLPGSGIRHVDGEEAEWRLPAGATCWFGERNSSWKLLTYAGEFISTPIENLHAVSKQGSIQMMPLMCEYPDSLYLTVLEAGLFNYSGMRLKTFPGGVMQADFTESLGFDVDGEILTPWRVLMISRNLDEVVNNHLLTDLAPEADPMLFGDTGWIRPGRSVWSWWSNIDGRFMTQEGERAMIDRAADLGFEYTTLDEGWEDKNDKWGFVSGLVEYGRSKGVGVILWRHWNRLNNPDGNYAAMAAFMDTVAASGVKGLKIDYMNGESKRCIDFNERALQLAAQRRLMVNFHGCQKPTGEARTYPNEITREAVRGMELNRITADYRVRMASKGTPVKETPHVKGGENQCIPASHNVVLPLTRGAYGAVDYTPIGFSMPGNTTVAHQLAMAYLLDSPLMTMAENPFYLFREENLKPLLPMIRTMPVVWDEVRVLPATKMGKILAMAKRSGRDWYVAAVTTDSVRIPLSFDFLDYDRMYHMELVSDAGDDKGKFIKREVLMDEAGLNNVDLAENGGMVIKITDMGQRAPVEFKLWDKKKPMRKAKVSGEEYMDRNGHVWNVSDPALAIYPADSLRNTGVTVIICPGGGYAFGSYLKEGVWFAEWLAENGITAAVLKYRMPGGEAEIPAEDAARAFEIMAENADRFGISSDKIGIMGFSAGGHLAATMTVHGKGAARPAFSVLMYPVITMDATLTHQGSRRSLLGDKPATEAVKYYSTELQVSPRTPPTLIMASYDDRTVKVENSMRFFDSLKRNGVDASIHIFPEGGHGWGFKKDFRYHEDMKSLLLDWLRGR